MFETLRTEIYDEIMKFYKEKGLKESENLPFLRYILSIPIRVIEEQERSLINQQKTNG